MDLANAKRALRERMRALRAAELTPDRARTIGRIVAERVVALAVYPRTSRLVLYASMPDEIDMRPLFAHAVAEGRPVLFPRCLAGRKLGFAAVSSWSELAPGRYGLLEPPAGRRDETPGHGDLVLVPGVAFDRRGARLGRGGGHYDRTFAEAGGPLLVGAAASFQLLDAVPAGPLDRRVDFVVTESETVIVSETAHAQGCDGVSSGSREA